MQNKNWLERLAAAVRAKLPQDDLSIESRPSYRTVSGWYVSVAKVRNLPYVCKLLLFLDRGSGHPQRRLWYGFWTPTQSDLAAIENAGERVLKKRSIHDIEDRQLARREFGVPFTEANIAAREHYYGIYLWQGPDVPGSQSPNVVRRIATFGTQVAIQIRGVSPLTELESGEGARQDSGNGSPRERVKGSILGRRGQAHFRKRLLQAFGGRCCVTGCTLTPLLEAAHIRLVPGADLHRLPNGLLLRSDVHTLFDLGLLKIQPDTLLLHLSPMLKRSEYRAYERVRLKGPPKALAGLNTSGLRRRWKAGWGAG